MFSFAEHEEVAKRRFKAESINSAPARSAFIMLLESFFFPKPQVISRICPCFVVGINGHVSFRIAVEILGEDVGTVPARYTDHLWSR